MDPKDTTSAAKDSSAPPEKYFSIFGFIIVRKADFLAATAFLLAASSTLYQVGNWMSGPHIEIYSPDSVTVFASRYQDNRPIIRIAGQITLTNSGQPSGSATIKNVGVTIWVGDREVTREYWLAFPNLVRDGRRLTVEPTSYAAPIEISGGNTVSRLTSFAPHQRRCQGTPLCNRYADYITKAAFVKLLAEKIGQQLVFRFSGETFQHGTIDEAACSAVIDHNLLVYLETDGWHSVQCEPIEVNQSGWFK